jgi:signal transduction histidine kinase
MRLSIRVKWPLAVATLILIVGSAISAAAYVALRRTLIESAHVRLETLGDQFRERLQVSQEAAQARTSTVVRRPALAAYLAGPSPAREADARAAMDQTGPSGDSIVRTELRDRDGQIRLAVDNSDGESHRALLSTVEWPALVAVVPSQPATSQPGAVRIGYGKLIQNGETILYPAVAEIPDWPAGYLVTWRRVSFSEQVRQQLSEILGSEATFYYGNADGSLWTDLGGPTAGPPVPARFGSVIEFDRPGRGRELAVVHPVPLTPFVLSIEFPEAAVLAPATRFLRIVVGIAAIFIALGGVASWLLSRRVTGHLQKLTDAADSIAHGHPWTWVHEPRSDELGRLSASFTTMARQIEESQARLRGQIAERTGQLQEAQESLARREKLALVGQLAGSIGHEIRNPLGVMANAIYYLEAVQADAPPDVREYLGILKQQVQLSSKIVNDLLDLSRTTPAAREPVAIRTIVSARLQQLDPKQSRIESDIPADLPPVHVDPVHVGHVMDNLLTNAVQAIDGQAGVITVRARRAGAGFVCIEVADTGPGVAAENVHKIFEPLFTTKARGIGLGLALSKSLAQANGGDLTLVSTPGRGATFALKLPVAGDTA